ncbi:MAG TPA: hypothetical protein VGP68_03610 [Gemmataceae bacterium]|jgi:hypothetical protein|nr:hypothetical protein [Gemmataceae bacterium]
MDQSSVLRGREAMTTLGKSMSLLVCSMALVTLDGCSMYEAATFNAFAEPIATTNVQVTCIRDHIVAKETWDTIRASEPEQNYSQDYAEGFKAGFADYLKVGGITVPTSMPPYRYWGRKYEYPEGRAAVDDWYAGYQRGALLAHDSPLRDLAVVPTIAVLPPSKETIRIADVDYSGTKGNASVQLLGDPAKTAQPTK